MALNQLTLEVYVTNLFDARGVTSKTNGCGFNTCRGEQYVIYNNPRLVGLRFGQRF